MDHDIDIEEHDVLDNPMIRNIFPDISQIKTEVPDFDADPEDQSGYSSQICFEDNPLEDDKYDEFKDDEMDYVETEPTDYDPGDIYYSNKIIIGSKPNLTTELVLPETDLYIEALNSNLRIHVEDWGEILKTNPCFCIECGTLFATINAVDAHKMIAHSFLVEVKEEKVHRNFAKKSTVVHKIEDGPVKQCSHCNVIFPNVNALTHHLYEILGVKDNNEDKATDESICDEAEDTAFKCSKCGCIFMREKPFIKHLKSNHSFLGSDASNFAIPPLPYPLSLKCMYCYSLTTSLKSHNAHIKKKHENLFFKKYNEETVYKCLLCKEVFERYGLARYHRKTVHPKMCSQPILKRVVRIPCTRPGTEAVTKPMVAKGAVNSTPKPETSTKVVQKEFKHIRSTRRRMDVTLYKQSRTVELTNSPIPKSVLFRCKKCNIHFISASLAMRHIPVCVNGCSKYIECERCKRVIRFEDRHIHEYQHKVSDKLKVYDISVRVLERTLCKCPQCEICYDDRDFWTHFDECGLGGSFYCRKCDVQISAQNIEAHEFKHNNNVKDFIVINFVSIDDAKTEVICKNVKGQVIPKKFPKVKSVKTNILKNKVKNIKVESKIENKAAVVRKPKMTLRYCEVCECAFTSLRHLKVYPECKVALKKRVCLYCGLYFTRNMYAKHQSVHKQKQVTLHDFEFVDFLNSEKVIPVPPEYPKCSKCNVYFINNSHILVHNCLEQTVEICRECNKEFSPSAFRLHTQFHLYGKVARVQENELRKDNMPVLLQKYKSLKKMWNILYLCSDCEMLTDNYDYTVEHSQNHLNNIIDDKKTYVKTCTKCDLEFESKAYLKHKKLHSGTTLNIKRNSFKTLTYNFRNLKTGNWFNMFGDLHKDHVNCIISQSIYKATKNVRMKVLRVGQGATFYQCATCKNYIGEYSVYDHTHNERCSLKELDRKPPPIGKHSKIISFNHQFDVEFNSTLKIINKSKIDEKKKLKSVKKPYNVYQCVKCSVTILHRQNTPRHKCTKRRTWHCKKCDLPYLIQRKHEMYHASLPNFNKYTINVVKFNLDYNANSKPKMKSKINVKFPSKIAAKIKNKVLKPAAPNLVPVTKVYKCGKCGLHFTSMLMIGEHFDICTRQTIQSSKCSRCKLLFPTNILVNHLVNHHRYNDRKIVVELAEPRKKQVKLYECARCSLMFPHKIDAIDHSDCGTNNGERCHDCNYIFHTDSFEAHECAEYIQNDIITVNDTEDIAFNGPLDDTVKSVDTDSRDAICSELERAVFKCAECDVYFINMASWYLHIEADHVMKYRSGKCDMCHLTFNSTRAVTNHQKIHHKNRKNDFYVKVMDSDTIKGMKTSNDTECKYVLGGDFDPKVGKKYGVTEKMYSAMLKTNYDNTLYKCHQCPQHFVTKATWLKHMYSPTNHDIRVMKCPECEYTFMEASLLKHQFVHHYKMKLMKEEIHVIDFTGTKLHKSNDEVITSKASDFSMMADSNDACDDNLGESAAKKTKYAPMNCIDDENVVSSSTKDFM